MLRAEPGDLLLDDGGSCPGDRVFRSDGRGCDTEPDGNRGVHEQPRVLGVEFGFFVSLGGVPDFLLGRLSGPRDPQQPVSGRLQRILDLHREEGELAGLAFRFEHIEDFVNSADPGEAVSDLQAVVERRHGQTGHERVDPDGEPG